MTLHDFEDGPGSIFFLSGLYLVLVYPPCQGVNRKEVECQLFALCTPGLCWNASSHRPRASSIGFIPHLPRLALRDKVEEEEELLIEIYGGLRWVKRRQE